MPKASSSKTKYYAVRIGREGPKIYGTWEECRENVSRWPKAMHKSFRSKSEAEQWIQNTSTVAPSQDVVDLTFDNSPPRPPAVKREVVDLTQDSPIKNAPTGTPRLIFTNSTARPSSPQTPCPPTKEELILSTEQVKVLGMVKRGRSVFFTGSAGTGKSVLLREIIKHFGGSASYRLAITASTGIAAVNIGGVTLHSWSGIGLGQEPAKKLAERLMFQPNKVPSDRWKNTNTLIVDEISMIDGELLDKLEYIGRTLRNSEKPFGGIQLILSGDFCQLPPVPDRSKDANQVKFAFDAECWRRCVPETVALSRVFRQKEQDFVDMLNSMRWGHLTPQSTAAFQALNRGVKYSDGIEPTELYSTRREVENANNTRLMQLKSEACTFTAFDTPGKDSNDRPVPYNKVPSILERLVATKLLTLKIGAQVMLIKNLVQGKLVNGSVGKVIEFSTYQSAKEQGVQVPQQEGEKQQPSKYANDPKSRVWPIVQFTNGQTIICSPEEFTVNNASGEMEAKREQVPLILAWALSIHKSQGQTLERVKVDLGTIFEKGQAYVALSRATSMKTLQVLRFDPSKVMAHPRVLEWHRQQEEDRQFDDLDMDF